MAETLALSLAKPLFLHDINDKSLSVARGTPNSAQTASILSRFCWHSGELGWPNEVVQIMVYCRDPNIEHDPLQGIRNGGKDFWG